MKTKLSFLLAVLFLSACGLFWGPTTTVKAFMLAAQNGKIETMTKLFSAHAVHTVGIDEIRSNNQQFAQMVQRAAAANGDYHMTEIQESPAPPPYSGKHVSFFYKNERGTDSMKLVFNLVKEGSAWKIDKMGGAEMDKVILQDPSTAPSAEKPPPPPPPFPGKDETTAPASKTVSGGVLNGKAISLPQPPYPAIARAAKASGTVVVQVTIDEDGNVTSAHAVSGHPLLQAGSVLAARSAKFSPTKLAGQPVKVTGLITYSFQPQ